MSEKDKKFKKDPWFAKRSEVMFVTGATRKQMEYWEQIRIIRSKKKKSNGAKFFSEKQMLLIAVLVKLRAEKFIPSDILELKFGLSEFCKKTKVEFEDVKFILTDSTILFYQKDDFVLTTKKQNKRKMEVSFTDVLNEIHVKKIEYLASKTGKKTKQSDTISE